MRAPFLILTLSLATLGGCRKSVFVSSTVATAPDTLITGTVIRSAGTWSAHHPQGSHRLEVTISGTSISWQVIDEEKHPGGGTSAGSSSSGMTLSSPADPWFIFVESPQRLWFFNGSTELSYHLSSEEGGSRSGPAIFSGELQPTDEEIPAELVPHLPPDLQKKLSAKITPPVDRPSF